MFRHLTRPTVHPLPCVHIEVEDEEVLCPGSSDEEDAHQRRAKKRRRTELSKLFLEGSPLHIESAHLRGPFEKGWSNPWARGPRVRPKIEPGSRVDRRRVATGQTEVRSSQAFNQPNRPDQPNGVPCKDNLRIRNQTAIASDERTLPKSTSPSPNRRLSASHKPSVSSSKVQGHSPRAENAEQRQRNEAWLGRNGNYVPRDRPDRPNSPTPTSGIERQSRLTNGHVHLPSPNTVILPPPPVAIATDAAHGDLQGSKVQSPNRPAPISNGVASERIDTTSAPAPGIFPKQPQPKRRRDGHGPEFIPPPKDRGKPDRAKASTLQTSPGNPTSPPNPRIGINTNHTKGASTGLALNATHGHHSRNENGHSSHVSRAHRLEAPTAQKGSSEAGPQSNLNRASTPGTGPGKSPEQMFAEFMGYLRTDQALPQKRKLSFTDSGNVKTSKRPALPVSKNNAYNTTKAQLQMSDKPHQSGSAFANAMNAIPTARSGGHGSPRQPTHVTGTHVSGNHVNGVDRTSSARMNAPAHSGPVPAAGQTFPRVDGSGYARTNAYSSKSMSGSILSDRDIPSATSPRATQDNSKPASTNGSLRLNNLPPIGSLPSISDLPEAQIVPPPPLLQNRSSSSFSRNALNTVESLAPAPNTLRGSGNGRHGGSNLIAQSPTSNDASFEGDSYAGLSTQAAFTKAQQGLRSADSSRKPSAPPTTGKFEPDIRHRNFSLDTPQSQLPGTPFILENLKNSSPLELRDRVTTSRTTVRSPTNEESHVHRSVSRPTLGNNHSRQEQHFGNNWETGRRYDQSGRIHAGSQPMSRSDVARSMPVDHATRPFSSNMNPAPSVMDGQVQPRASFPAPSGIPAAQRQDQPPVPMPATRQEGQQLSKASHPTVVSENQGTSNWPPSGSPVQAARHEERRASPTTMLKQDLGKSLKIVKTELDKLSISAEETAGDNLDMVLFQQFKITIADWAAEYHSKMVPEEEMDRGKSEAEKVMAKKQRNMAVEPYLLLLREFQAIPAGRAPAKDWPLDVACKLAAIKWPSHRRQSQLQGEKPTGLKEAASKVPESSTTSTDPAQGPPMEARRKPAPPAFEPVMIAKTTPGAAEAKGHVTFDSEAQPPVSAVPKASPTKVAAPPIESVQTKSPPIPTDISRSSLRQSPQTPVETSKPLSPDAPPESHNPVHTMGNPPSTYSQIHANQPRSVDKGAQSQSSRRSPETASVVKNPEAGKHSYPLPPKPPTPVSQLQIASPSSQLQTTFTESSPVPKISPTQVSPVSVTNGRLPSSSSSSSRRKAAPPTQSDEVIVLPDDDEDDDECMIIPDPSSQISPQSSFAQDGQQQQQFGPPPSTGGSSLNASTPWTVGQVASSGSAKRQEPPVQKERPYAENYTNGQRRNIPIEQRNTTHDDHQPHHRLPRSRHSDNQLHRNRPLEPKTVHHHPHHDHHKSTDGRSRMRTTDAKGINGMIHGRPNPVSTPAEFNIRGAAANNNFHHSNNNYSVAAITQDSGSGQNSANSVWDPSTAQDIDEFCSFLDGPLDAPQPIGGSNAATSSGNAARKPDNYW